MLKTASVDEFKLKIYGHIPLANFKLLVCQPNMCLPLFFSLLIGANRDVTIQEKIAHNKEIFATFVVEEK